MSNKDALFSITGTGRESVPIVRWFCLLVAWDGILPAIVLAAPVLVNLLFPRMPTVRELVAVLLPVTVFLIRVLVGMSHIKGNHCSDHLKTFQRVAMFIAAFCFVLIDCVLILAQNLPAGAMWSNPSDRILWIVLASIYLTFMTFALYPGRATASETFVLDHETV